MTPPTDLGEAVAAQRAAAERLHKVQARQPRVDGIVGYVESFLEENHVSVRLARLFDIEDDRR